MQGNRYMTLTMHEAAMSCNLKIIALDRPGIGTSSPQPQRKVADYPADVLQLCQQLDIHQFSIMASSAGTMYALACTLASETKDMVVGKVRKETGVPLLLPHWPYNCPLKHSVMLGDLSCSRVLSWTCSLHLSECGLCLLISVYQSKTKLSTGH